MYLPVGFRSPCRSDRSRPARDEISSFPPKVSSPALDHVSRPFFIFGSPPFVGSFFKAGGGAVAMVNNNTSFSCMKHKLKHIEIAVGFRGIRVAGSLQNFQRGALAWVSLSSTSHRLRTCILSVCRTSQGHQGHPFSQPALSFPTRPVTKGC
jgi:hypothetical protein